MKIGHIIQRCACLLPYLKASTLCYIMLLDRNRSENPSISPAAPCPQLPLHFWLHVLLDRQNPEAPHCGEISRRETLMTMMWMDGRRHVKSRGCH